MAITQATSLADFSAGIGTAGAVLQVDNADGRVGIGTTDPQADLQVGIAITMDGTAGVITASSFSGSGANLTFTGADISAATGTFTGNVSVGGTLTYEDVTNVDSVGVITARSGVRVTGGDIQAGDTSTGFSGTVIFGFSTTTAANAGTIQAKNFGSGGANFVGLDAAGNDTARILTDGGALFAGDVSIADKIVHTGDTNTAIRFPAADTFTVETGGTEALRVDSSQRLLIGTTSTSGDQSDGDLVVEGASQGELYLSRGSTPANSGGGLGFIHFTGDNGEDSASIRVYSDGGTWTNGSSHPSSMRFETTANGASSPTERLRIDSGGLLLIGHTSDVMGNQVQSFTTGGNNYAAGRFANNTGGPDIVLRKSRNGTVGSHTIVQDDDDLGNIFWGGSNGSAFKNGARITASVDGTPGTGDDMPARLTFFTSADGSSSPTERLRIDSAGRVAINNTSPSSFDAGADNLVVGSGSGDNGITVYSGNSSLANLYFADGTSSAAEKYAGGLNYNHSTNTLAFFTNDGTTRMSIDSSGQVFMGSSSSTFNVIANTYNQAALHLSGGGSGSANIDLHGSNHSSDAKVITFDTNSSERMRITSDGKAFFAITSDASTANLGISLDGPRGRADWFTADTEKCIRFYKQNGNENGSISMNTSSVSYNTSSDYRLKENVVDIADGITRVKQLAPKRFNFIADTETTVDGFLAHEAQAVVPEAITGTHNEVDENGDPVYQSIDQSKLVPLLTAALKEAIAEIETLKTKVAALEGS